MNYFIVLIDYHGHKGMEAIIHPEDTRRQIVEEVRDVLASDDKSLVHVKFVSEGRPCEADFIEDVTSDICSEAGYPDAPLSPVNRQAAAWDHARDYRKHEAVR